MSRAGETAKGALGGAATGATIGAVGGPVGAAVGGVAGGLIGGIGSYLSSSDNNNKQYQDRQEMIDRIRAGYAPGGIANQSAPQAQATQAGAAAQMTPAQMQAAQLQMGDDPFRRAQLAQLGQLQGIASGQQQGAGELAVHRQMANALAIQQANARMARGGNAALAYRNAANQSAALGSTAAGMGQQSALQDQMAAQGLLGQIGAAGRAGDYSTANANAGYLQQAGLQNAGFQQQAGLQNAQLDQQSRQYNASNQQAANLANAGFYQTGQQMNANNYLNLLNQQGTINANEMTGTNSAAQINQNSGLGAPLMSVGGQVLGAYLASRGNGGQVASDERLKTDVTDERAKIDAMLDGLRPVGWRYKDPKFGEGRHSGILAQDMERSEAGRQIVTETPEGKMLDVKKAVSAALASSARLNERLRKLEGR